MLVEGLLCEDFFNKALHEGAFKFSVFNAGNELDSSFNQILLFSKWQDCEVEGSSGRK